jgi:hypothetical protein
MERGDSRMWLRIRLEETRGGPLQVRVTGSGLHSGHRGAIPDPTLAGTPTRLLPILGGLAVSVPDGLERTARALLDRPRGWPTSEPPPLGVFLDVADALLADLEAEVLHPIEHALVRALLPNLPDSRLVAVLQPGQSPPALAEPFDLPLRLLAVGREAATRILALSSRNTWFDREGLLAPILVQSSALESTQLAEGLEVDVLIATPENCPGLTDRGVRARLVILLGSDGRARPALPLGRSVLLPLPGGEDRVDLVLEALAHDVPPHEALAALPPLKRPRLISTPETAHDLRLGTVLGRHAVDLHRIETATPRTIIEGSNLARMDLHLRGIAFDRGVHGLRSLATGRQFVRDHGRSRRPTPRAPSRRGGPPDDRPAIAGPDSLAIEAEFRVLDAALRRGEDVKTTSRDLYLSKTTSLQAGASYVLDLRIGRRSSHSLVEGPQPAVDDDLPPPVADGWDLELVVWPGAFGVLGPSRLAWHLPRTGPSDLLEVALVAPVDPAVHTLRYAIFHLGNLVQSYLFTARMNTTETLSPDPAVTARLDYSGTSGWTEIGRLTPRRVSLVLNHTGRGAHRAYAHLDEVDLEWDIADDMQAEVVAPLRAILAEHARLAAPKAAEREAALRSLADAGAAAFRGLFDAEGRARRGAEEVEWHAGRDALRALGLTADETIQVARADPHRAIPWSLLYDWLLPDDITRAEVCWGGALGAPCAHGPNDRVICARGFWGVRHRIEELVDRGRAHPRHLPTGDPRLTLALGIRNSHVEGLQTDLVGLLKTRVLAATDGLLDHLWAATGRSAVVGVVGHFDENARAIECGTAEVRLTAKAVTDRAYAAGDWTPPSPLVMLLACESGAVTAEDVTSHLRALLAAGAAGLVVTESVVRTSHVRAFASAFINDVFGTAATVGAAMQAVRLRLLAEQQLLPVLSFTAYGSADLRPAD